jgi:hypothetical protein
MNTLKKLTIILTILILLNTGLVIGAILLTKKTSADTILIENEITKLNKRHLEISSLRENLGKIKEIENSILAYEKHLFSRNNELSDLRLIEDLENIAQKNNVVQKIILSNIDDKNSEKIEIVISIDGTYGQAIRYLNDLENYQFFVIIEKIEIIPQISNKSDPNNPIVSLRLKISIYAK